MWLRQYSNSEIMKNKDAIVVALYNWADTFWWELDEEGEPTDIPFDYVIRLAKNLENEKCNEKDFEDIDFHIWQINYSGELVKIID